MLSVPSGAKIFLATLIGF